MTNFAAVAYHLRLFQAAEQAHAVGDSRALDSIMAGVDPVDLRQLAAELERAALVERESDSRSLQVSQVVPPDSRSASAAHRNGGEPTDGLDHECPPHSPVPAKDWPQSPPPFAPVFACTDDDMDLWWPE